MTVARTLSILSVLALSVGIAPAADLPTWKLAEIEKIGSGWSGPVEVDGRSCRTAMAGRGSSLTVPVWWGGKPRPPVGTVYVLKVTYKDTATRPIVFSSHAGVGSYWGLSEVHRFGGTGDGKWKTADVPISWDLVIRKNFFRKPSPGKVTEFAVRTNKNLPVESIVVTAAGADAAKKYFAETRQWIATVQGAKRTGASKGGKQEPVLPPAMKGQSIVPFARTYMVAVLPNSAPQKGEAGATLKLRMARNEYEPAQFAVYANGKALKNVDFSVSKLTGPGGALKCKVERRTAEFSAVQAGRSGGRFRLWPQRWWPAYAADIPAGQSHPFLLIVQTLGDASAPGTYKGSVKITAAGASAELPIEVEVVPVTLLPMKQAGLELGGCGFPTPQDMKTLVEHRHTGMHIWFGGTQPQFETVNGKLILDWYYLDSWFEYATKTLGITHMMWFMGGDPYGFPDTINLERDLYRYRAGDRAEHRREYLRKLNANPNKVLPKIRKTYVDFIRQTAVHAKKQGWPKLIIHPFDEPAKWVQSSKWDNPWHPVIGTGKWIKDHFKDACALIREGAKGHDNILTGGDMHHAKPSMIFLDDVDVFCTNAIHEDYKLGDKVRAAGVQFWQYSGTGDQTPAHTPRFTFGFYFGAFRSTGFLVWAYNAMGRFDTSSGRNWGYGWYTPFGTIYTPFMTGIREGLDDRLWMETYRKAVGEAKAKALLEGIGKQAVTQRTGRGRDTVRDFYAEIQPYGNIDKSRKENIDATVKAGK